MGALRYIFILLSVCLAIGCADYLDGVGSYVEKNVMVSLSSVPMRDCTVVYVTLNAEERLSNRAKFLINRMSMSSTAPLRCLAMMNSAMPLTSLPLPSNPERK